MSEKYVTFKREDKRETADTRKHTICRCWYYIVVMKGRWPDQKGEFQGSRCGGTIEEMLGGESRWRTRTVDAAPVVTWLEPFDDKHIVIENWCFLFSCINAMMNSSSWVPRSAAYLLPFFCACLLWLRIRSLTFLNKFSALVPLRHNWGFFAYLLVIANFIGDDNGTISLA